MKHWLRECDRIVRYEIEDKIDSIAVALTVLLVIGLVILAIVANS